MVFPVPSVGVALLVYMPESAATATVRRTSAAEGGTAMLECLLRAVNGLPGVGCDEDECVYWRTVEQLDIAEEPVPGECAIQHFTMLDGGAEIAAWLLSVKLRVESSRSYPAGP